MMIKKQIWIILVLWVAVLSIAHAQINLSAVAGGGIADLQTGLPFSDNSDLKEYLKPGPLMQLGVSVSSTFRKEGMLRWESQLLLRRSTLRSVPIDYDKAGCGPFGAGGICMSPFPRDYSNVYQWSYWSVNVPISLNFQVFGPIGWKIGGNANYILSEFPDEDKIKINGGYPSLDTKFESFNWQGHIGFFTTLGPKIRLEALAFSDFKPRLTHGEYSSDGQPVFPEYREMGLYLNVLYKLNR